VQHGGGGFRTAADGGVALQGGSEVTQQESMLNSTHADQDADFRDRKQAV